VSLISPRRVFGYAADGFHFVTSKPVKSVPSKWDVLAKIQSVSDKLFAAPAPEPVPGFHVRSQGDVDVRSQKDINLWAIDPQSRARVTSGFAAELSAMHAAGISARMGTAEVLGRNVVLGSTPERAKGAAAIVLAGAASVAADAAVEACIYRIHKNEKELVETLEKHRMLLVGEDALMLRIKNPAKFAKANALDAAGDALAAVLQVDYAALRGLKTAQTAAYKTYQAALEAAPLKSPVATAMDWDGKQVQAIAEKIEMASAEKVDVFSKDVSVASTGSIELKSEPPLPGLPGKGTVKVTSDKVEIDVSGNFKVVVSGTGVSVVAAGQTILETDGVTATLQLGASSVKLTATTLDLAGGVATNVTGGMINLG
jgi:hypothetical protein